MKARALLCMAAAALCAAAPVSGEDADERTSRLNAAIFGRGAAVDGDERKYREDYDDLQTGGGFDFFVEDQRDRGVYATGGGSLLFAERGDGFDGTELALAGGRWGRYHLEARISLLQSYYDDSHEAPLRTAFPFTNELGRDLHTNRADVDVEAVTLFGDGGLLSVRYRHDQMDGERSILKGSAVEDLSVFAFQAPAFQGIDRNSDGVEVRAVAPAGPVRLAIDALYRHRESEVATNEINYAPTALRDRVRYEDAFDVDVAHGGVLLSSTSDPRIQGHGGYRIAWVDSNGSSTQSGGTTSLDPRRTAEQADVESLTHAGHAGLILRPFADLAIRASYSVRDRDRTGTGGELRTPAGGADAQRLSTHTQKDLSSHKPRISLTYSGLRRTRLRASYAFDQTSRDLDLESLIDRDGPSAVDRIQRTDEDIYTHRARAGARSRLARRLTGEVGYDLMRQEIDQKVRELVNESALGNRERDRDRVFAKLRLRPAQRTSLELGGEWDRAKFRRTDVPGDSSTEVEGYRIRAQANSTLLQGLSTHAAVSYADRDYTVGEDSPRNLDIFREIDFRDRYVSGSLLAAWAASAQLSLRGRYTVAHASGDQDNLSSRVHLDASYRPTPEIGLATGYSYLGFDEDLYSGDDFDGHFAWARVEVGF